MINYLYKNVTVENHMSYVKEGWNSIKKMLNEIDELYSLYDTRSILNENDFYKSFFGRAKNRTMIKENPQLYNSVMHHSQLLEETMKRDGRYCGSYNFKYRLKFIVELECDIELLKCECGRRYTWNKYCRKCPSYHIKAGNRPHTEPSKRKMRIAALNNIANLSGKVSPRYNPMACEAIDEYGKENDYTFQHAENGGEYHIKELGYFVDGYDMKKNIVIEYDEEHHFDSYDSLTDSDMERQQQIIDFLGCTFIRIRGKDGTISIH